MFCQRFLQLPQDHSFFLLGPRGAGKSTLVKHQFTHDTCIFFDLSFLEIPMNSRILSSPYQKKNRMLLLMRFKKYQNSLTSCTSLLNPPTSKDIMGQIG